MRGVCRKLFQEELLEGLSLAHLWNRKIYLTVNTLTKQDELSGLCDWIAPFYEAGLDGVIVQDMGVLEKLRKNFPGMELHASTQMSGDGEQKCPVFKNRWASVGLSRRGN